MARSFTSSPSNVSELGYLLQQLEVVQPDQWKLAARGSSSLTNILDGLQQQSAWWSSAHPAISDFQRDCINARLGQGFRDLDRDLRVNNYLVIGKLGEGGMAVVHKTWSLEQGQILALKRLVGNGQVLRDRLDREAQILRLLDDPRITQFVAYEAIEDGSGHLLAMEYIEGQTLREVLKSQSKVSLADAVSWTADLLDALHHAHECGVIHRDVTPRNIMVVSGANADRRLVKLLDFGLGKVTSPLNQVPEIGGVGDLTGQSQAIGTFQYMSPEQFRDTASVTGAADIYSLGCSFYEMLSGRPPFTETQFSALLMKHMHETPLAIEQLCPGIPDYISDALKRMLSKKPEIRADARTIKSILISKSPRQSVGDIKIRFSEDRLTQQSLKPERIPSEIQKAIEPGVSQIPTIVTEWGRRQGVLEHPVNSWQILLFGSSEFSRSARFIDPLPTPFDILHSIANRLWYAALLLFLLAIFRLIVS